MLLTYSLTIFTSAFLLFLVQPMFARMMLPLLGGAPAVWNTALVFYQLALLGGYAYAHASVKWLGIRCQIYLHLSLMLLVVAALPIGVPAGWAPPVETNPVLWILGRMSISVGLPFFVVSASSPLLQRWFSSTRHRNSSDPYFLYSASNLGSMLALLAYPFLVEPALRLTRQSRWWAIGYGVLAVMMTACAAFTQTWKRPKDEHLARHPESTASVAATSGAESKGISQSKDHTATATKPTIVQQMRWVVLAFVPSSLMISVTTYLTTDIAAVPLLWVIPLAIYLLTFILVFAGKPRVSHEWMVKTLPIFTLPLVITLAIRGSDPIALVVPLHLITFFVIAMVCHGELSLGRPPAQELTKFYLLLSVGGVLGGAFNALLAPLVFNVIAEYPIVLTLACLLLPWKTDDPPRSRARLMDLVLPGIVGLSCVGLILALQGVDLLPLPLRIALMFGLPALACFSFSRRPLRFALAVGAVFIAATFYLGSQGRVLYAERSFYGVSKVTLDDSARFHQIMHGSTLHGRQWIDSARRREPVAYYSRMGPLGQIFETHSHSGTFRRIAGIGLGAGGITAYALPGQQWTYYEIDPVVEKIARDSRFFTYLRDCPADLEVILGDGRLSLAKAPDAEFGLIILDAYSSDALPVHLLTREALQLYLKKLAPTGLLVFHISNRYLDVEPILGGLARDAGLYALIRSDTNLSIQEAAQGKTGSRYLIMARTLADFGSLSSDSRWVPPKRRDDIPVWTDDYSSILKVLRLHH